jgi:glutathione S-transferase
MVYQLYYWPTIQGRGEFVRLALEEAGAAYVDVARGDNGVKEMMDALAANGHPSFAPPFLTAGALTIGQVANILLYLGEHLHLAPRGEAARIWTHQLQLTIADLVAEAHDTHHPVSGDSYYEDQKPEAQKRAAEFVKTRIPKFMDYFARALGEHDYLNGAHVSYADLSLFQVIAGLRYAFPKAMGRSEQQHPQLAALHDRVAQRPKIAAYLASERRLPFSEEGIFRHYPELDH